MYTHLKERQHYEDSYGHATVYLARVKMKSFLDFRDKWLEMMPSNEENRRRNPFHLNNIYMMIGSRLVEHYNKRE